MSDQPTQPLRFFVSYAHKDESFKDELVSFMAPLRRSGAIASWDDRQIPIGGEWDKQIKSEMNKADVILLLISSDFMNSSYCNDVEVVRAMERHHDNADSAVVVPIILRFCDWTDAPFAKLQALPKNATPISKYEDKDEAYLYIVNQIKNLIKSRNKPASSESNTQASTQNSPQTFDNVVPPVVDNATTPSPSQKTLDHDKVRNLIATNKVEEVLKIMIEVAEDKNTDVHSTLLLKSGEFSEIKRETLMGITPPADLRMRKAQLNYSLLELLKQL